jgi:mono/diheme cytochrome c family protein
MGKRPTVWTSFVCAALLCAAIDHVRATPAAQQPAAAAVSTERAVLDRYCVGCHNDRLSSGGLTLSTGAVDPDRVSRDLTVWEKVVRKLRARAMPPPATGRTRPDEPTYDALIAYLEHALDQAAAEHPDPGPAERFRRLNRFEYQNAVRDLLDLDVDVTSMLPTDDSSHGFDNVNVAAVSPTLLDRYLAAAQKISRLAMGNVVGPATAHTVVLAPDLTQDDRIEGLPFGTRGGTTFRYTFPVDGVYRIDIKLTRDRDERIEGSFHEQLDVLLDGERLQSFALAPRKEGSAQQLNTFTNAAQETDTGLTLRTSVPAGPHEMTATFRKAPTTLSEAERQPNKANYSYRSRAAVFSVTVAGPFDTTSRGDSPSRRRILICRPATASEETACARTILASLTRRAYRRPVTSSDLDPLLRFYTQARTDGEDFEAGIERSLRALLVSRGFLFRVETPSATSSSPVHRITNLDLASRLSFFLWSSIPDDELLDAAARGTLHEPAILERQVHRMLSDPRAVALVRSFADQWLYLRNLQTVTRDTRLFPDFDDNLRQAFRRETELLFSSILREDRSVLDLLRADYTFVNERLAAHYGIPNVYGSDFRRVTLPAQSVRRGLLGHASILTVTSYADRTSPVQRGKWVLENILGMPPSPPPPDVPPLKEAAAGAKVLSMRERMVAHRASPTCASCHQVMDPIGLAFENFDAVGRYRERMGEAGEPAGPAIDASGGLPDGTRVNGAVAMREALLRHADLFVATTTEKLLIYAIGRGLEPADAAAVRAIVREAQPQDYRWSALIMGVVRSTPFQMRRSE